MARRPVFWCLALGLLALLSACGGGGRGGGTTPPVNNPGHGNHGGGYNSGYSDGYQDGYSDRFHDDPWYFDSYRNNNYYDNYNYSNNYDNGYYSSSRQLSSHPWDCDCGCRDNLTVYQTETYYESAGGLGSPALSAGSSSGNLPLSGAGSDGMLDSLELDVLQMQRPAGVSELLWADLKQAAKEAARSVSLAGSGARDPGEGGRVTDFTAEPGSQPDTIRFSWTYRNDGDYDFDGRVRAADIAQVGIWYGRTDSDPDWSRAKIADGNGDGRITIADASVIGINYGSQVDEYMVCIRLGDYNKDQALDWLDYELLHDVNYSTGRQTMPPWFDGLTAAELLGEPYAGSYDRFYTFGSVIPGYVPAIDVRFSIECSSRGFDPHGIPVQIDVDRTAAGVISNYRNSYSQEIREGFFTSTDTTSPLSNTVVIP